MRSFRWCAMHYLTQWWEMDRRFIEEFQLEPIQPKSVQQMCLRYGVDRNFAGSGEAKYTDFCNLLNNVRNKQLSRANVTPFIQEQLGNMKKQYGDRVLSATTKGFWMLKRHPVVIYDRFSLGGLRAESKSKVPDGEYAEYVDAWFPFFERSKEKISDAQEWLLGSEFIASLSGEWTVEKDETKRFIASEDFANRVADMYLLHRGKEQ